MISLRIANNIPPIYTSPSVDSLNWVPDAADVKILSKSKYICSSCGLKSKESQECKSGYLEIVRLNGRDEVLCNMCAQVLFIARSVNDRANNGLIIYCPSIDQGEVCSLAQKLFFSRMRDDENSEKARSIINRISSDLVDPVTNLIPDFESGTAKQFGTIIDSLSPRGRENLSPVIAQLRYWPFEEIFSKQVLYWSASLPSEFHE